MGIAQVVDDIRQNLAVVDTNCKLDDQDLIDTRQSLEHITCTLGMGWVWVIAQEQGEVAFHKQEIDIND